MVHKQSPLHKRLRGHRITRPNMCRSPSVLLDVDVVQRSLLGTLIDSILLHSENVDAKNPCA